MLYYSFLSDFKNNVNFLNFMIKYIKNFNFCHFILFFYPLNCAKYPFLCHIWGVGVPHQIAQKIYFAGRARRFLVSAWSATSRAQDRPTEGVKGRLRQGFDCFFSRGQAADACRAPQSAESCPRPQAQAYGDFGGHLSG